MRTEINNRPNLQIKEILEIVPGKYIKYAIFNDVVYDWRIPKGSTFNCNDVLVGGSYNIWTTDLGTNGRTTYDWKIADPLGDRTKDMHAVFAQPSSVKPEAIQGAHDAVVDELALDQDIIDLCAAISDEQPSPAVKYLIELILTKLLKD